MSVFFALLPAYLLGSMNGSLMLGRLRGVDIRQHGSGNAGGTNALRTQGKWFALGAVLIDVAKGLVARRPLYRFGWQRAAALQLSWVMCCQSGTAFGVARAQQPWLARCWPWMVRC